MISIHIIPSPSPSSRSSTCSMNSIAMICNFDLSPTMLMMLYALTDHFVATGSTADSWRGLTSALSVVALWRRAVQSFSNRAAGAAGAAGAAPDVVGSLSQSGRFGSPAHRIKWYRQVQVPSGKLI